MKAGYHTKHLIFHSENPGQTSIGSDSSIDAIHALAKDLLRKEGFIDQTIKDKPNSPDQKYILTEKGKMFLGGFEIE